MNKKPRVDFSGEQDGSLGGVAQNIHDMIMANAATFPALPITMPAFLTKILIFALLASVSVTLANPPSGKGDPGSRGAEGKGNVIFSNTILVKLTAQARAKLKVVGEDVNPSATGLASFDVICRDFGVNGFRSIVTLGVHRDPAAAINSWYKITLPGVEQRITLIEQTNDDSLNLVYSGAEPLGRLMARLKQDSSVESVALE